MTAIDKGKRQALARAAAQSSERMRVAAEKKRKERARAAERALVAQTADGMNPVFRARLHDAATKAANDPNAKALIEKADLEKRVRDARKEVGVDPDAIVPATFMGKPVQPSEVPESVAQRRARERGQKKL